MKVYINGKFIDADKAVVSIFDRGLRYGDGLFETMRAYNGRILFFKEHIERLRTSALFIAISKAALDRTLKGIKDNIEGLLKLNRLTEKDAYIRITLTRGGTLRTTHMPPERPLPTLIIDTEEIDLLAIERLKSQGVTTIGVEGSNYTTVGAVKSLNYLSNVLGKREAVKAGAYEAIFTCADGRILEGTSTNVFIVKDGVIKTPKLTCALDAILDGITRAAVIRIAREESIELREVSIFRKDLLESDEAFITNSIIEIVPLIGFDNKAIGRKSKGAPPRGGPITSLIQSRYKTFT
jgi:branched-chain amino acid aminotransferase